MEIERNFVRCWTYWLGRIQFHRPNGRRTRRMRIPLSFFNPIRMNIPGRMFWSCTFDILFREFFAFTDPGAMRMVGRENSGHSPSACPSGGPARGWQQNGTVLDCHGRRRGMRSSEINLPTEWSARRNDVSSGLILRTINFE